MKTFLLNPPTSASTSPLASLRIGSIASGFLLAMLLLLSGCVTTSPVNHAAKTLATTVATVDAAMQSYSTLVVLGQISDRDQANVSKLYTNYQATGVVGFERVFQRYLTD